MFCLYRQGLILKCHTAMQVLTTWVPVSPIGQTPLGGKSLWLWQLHYLEALVSAFSFSDPTLVIFHESKR